MPAGTVELCPRLQYLIFVGGVTLVIVLGVAQLWPPNSAGFWTVPLIVPLVLRSAMRLEMSSNGVSLNRRSAQWHEITYRRGRAGEVLASSGNWFQQVRFTPWMFERDWRRGQIGAAARVWAPDLLAQAAR